MTSPPALPDFSTPHSARMYDYYLGGKNNYAADRAAADQVLTWWPGVRAAARANREFLRRVVRHLVTEEGVRQFLDIGTGIPTEPNLHQVAQGEAPEARVVYVDKDELVLAHADALMRSSPRGRTTYVHADVTTDVDRILDEAFQTLDPHQPVALSLFALLHFVPDELDAHGLVRRLFEPLAPGSALVISHVTPDFDPEALGRVVDIYRSGGIATQVRGRDEVAAFFEGFDLIDPGIETPHRWRTTGAADQAALTELDKEVSAWAGAGLRR
ncbi:SAM-dependent methyltransferase [Streptomyces sp. B6B3]|uniref:SAM-dependent methyltransferase n=1 Tax=Streptomyces sp. B6B3 TaxID=3153570 RepID=UPI00325F6EB4